MIDAPAYAALVRQVAHEQAKLSTSAWFFEGTDHLRLRSFGSLAGVDLALEGRFLTVEGRVQPFSFRHIPSSNRTVVTSLHGLGEGFLLGASLRASAGTPRIGQVFIVLEVVRGLTGAIQPLGVLLEGYVTDTQRLGWPGAPQAGSTMGPGVLRSITGTDPAANVEISETVPTNARWRPLAIQFSLVTDATAANREVALTIDDGTTVFARVPSGFSQIATTTIVYSTFHHGPRNTLAQDTTKNFPLPRIDLQGGFRINTVTTARQATDNYGAPQLLVEEWIED